MEIPSGLRIVIARAVIEEPCFCIEVFSAKAQGELEALPVAVGVILGWVVPEGLGFLQTPDDTLLLIGDDAWGVQVIGVTATPASARARAGLEETGPRRGLLRIRLAATRLRLVRRCSGS